MVKPILSLRKAERERADRVRELSTHTVLLAGSEVPVTHPSMAPLLQAIDAACPDTFLPLKHPVIQLSLFKFCEVVIDEADCENGRSGSTSSVRSSTSGDSSSSSSDGELNEDDLDTYQRWLKKKKGPKSNKMKERDFAVKVQKKEQAQKAMEEAALSAAAASGGGASKDAHEQAVEAAKVAFDKAVKEDKTGALKAGMFSNTHFASVAKRAVKDAKAGKGKQEL